MSGIRKSTDVGLSNIERKALRGTEAQEAMLDYDEAQKGFRRKPRMLEKSAVGARDHHGTGSLYPTSELPDHTPDENIRFYSNS